MIEKIFIAMIAGLFGLIPVILQWLSGRRKTRSYEHKLSTLSKELELLEKLISVCNLGTENDDYQGSNDAVKRYKEEAERIFVEYKSLQENDLEQKPAPFEISFIRRAFLLFLPVTTMGWLLHTLFYFLMTFMLVMILPEWESPTIDPETGENQFTSLLIGLAVIFGPIFIILQRSAIRLRKKASEE